MSGGTRVVVFFDLDDTLVDHSGAERSASMRFYETIADRTRADSAESFAPLWKRVQDRQIERYFAGELTFVQQRRERIREIVESDLADAEAEADELFSVYLGYYERSWRAFPDVIPCLSALRADFVAVITNGDPEQQHKKLARTGLADRFDAVICSGEFGHTKPDPRIFHHACERAGVQPKEAIHIGDSRRLDFEGARDAGLRGILLVRGIEAAAFDPDISTVQSLDELPAIVARANR